jgi:hypothetical protein
MASCDERREQFDAAVTERMRPISTRVDKPDNDDPSIIKPN